MYFCSDFELKGLKRLVIILIYLSSCLLAAQAQGEDVDDELFDGLEDVIPQEPRQYKLKLQRWRYRNPVIQDGDTMWCYLLTELPVYAPLRFRSAHQQRTYNRLVYNVKKVLPLAQQVNSMIAETYEVLEQLPDKKSKEAHMRAVEKSIMEQYKPEMKKLTYSQGKLLIKLIDRECHSSSYDMIKAFMGPIRAGFWQVFAWGFGASLKKEYDPQGVDRLTERVVLMVESGQI